MQTSSPSRLNTLVLAFGYGALLVYLLVALWQSILSGGSSWQQADWLINFAAGPIRRGIGGHVILAAADAFGADPLILLGVIQAALVAALVIGIGWAIYALGLPDRLLILAISPAFLPFWAYEYLGSMRKEMVALAAFLPLLRPGMFPKTRAGVALFFFAVAVLLHEGNGFVAPFLAIALWVAVPNTAYAFATFGIAGLGFALALALPAVDDPTPICTSLLERGFRESFCGGSIRWLEFDLSRVLREGAVRIETNGFPYSIFLSMALAMIPVATALWKRPIWVAAALLSMLFFAPLYAVALDWGRWVFLHMACVTLTLLAVAAHRPVPGLQAPLERPWMIFFLVSSGLWSMSFYTGETNIGLLAGLVLMF